MDLDISVEPGIVHIKVIGAIDTEGGAELSNKFAEVANDSSILSVKFDLSEVPTITSAGIGKLLKFFKIIDSRKGKMVIAGISSGLRKQFAEVHLDKIIPVEK
jgi:anti-sigma B factor antagonist